MTLYLFTTSYPFGYGESFLEEEVSFLSRRFNKIIVVPLWNPYGSARRDVPSNFVVKEPIIKGRVHNQLNGLNFSKTLFLFSKDFVQNRVYKNMRRLKSWIRTFFLTNCMTSSRIINDIGKELTPQDICYFYWGVGLINMIPIWGKKAKYVARFHATADLWEDKRDNYTPLRKMIVEQLDLAVTISETGRNYFHSRYSNCKTIIGRLGAKDNGVSKKSEDGILRVLSCSNIIPLKRVPLILESLSFASKKRSIEWTHIGSGTELEKVKELAKELETDRFKVNLLGRLEHDSVIAFYKSNSVDIFINLSTSEGIPVSIMEAISFGVPCIATNVGATREIVTKETGILLSSNPTLEDVASAIEIITKNTYNPRNYWEHFYNSDYNYKTFAEELFRV